MRAQVSLEGQISRESVNASMARGEAPSGDLIPWTLSQQFQESDFPSLSGARVVRVACSPRMSLVRPETVIRYHVVRRKRGQPLGAEVLLVSPRPGGNTRA